MLLRNAVKLFKRVGNGKHRLIRGLSNQVEEQDEPKIPEKSEKLIPGTMKFYKKAEHRFMYPEFLPDPNMSQRNITREKLERKDMMNRRNQIEIPEFYVGSILSVTASDPFAPGCTNRFVGICITKELRGLRSFFILRNHVDQQGIEIRYDLYNPTILQITVLRLEKRLDEHLIYLRDCPPEFSTFSFDMDQEPRLESGEVPINPLKVPLRPKPWWAKWDRYILHGLTGADELRNIHEKKRWEERPDTFGERSHHHWQKHDLMKEYRKSIPEEDQAVIWEEVDKHHKEVLEVRRTERRKRLLEKKKKT